MPATQSLVRPDLPIPLPGTSHVALAPHRRSGAIAAWLMLGGFTVGALDMLSAMIYWGRLGVSPEHILQGVVAWIAGSPAYAGGWGNALLGALLYGLLMWGVVALYHVMAQRWPLLSRHPLRCGGAYGALAYLAIFQLLVPWMTGSHGNLDPAWIASCVIVYTTLVGIPCALFARVASRMRY